MNLRREEYRLAALERINDSGALRRNGRHPAAMYFAGVAAECMLRAWHRESTPFDERHDVVKLFRGCDDRLANLARGRLRTAILTIHLLWSNGLRYADEGKVRAFLKARQQDRGIHRGA